MYYFTFQVADELFFECPLVCKRCDGITKAGTRCKRQTCIGNELCWTHLLSLHNLRVKDTGEARGKGLFALSPRGRPGDVIFRRSQKIIHYGGEPVTDEELTRRYGDHTAPYGIAGQGGRFWDGACNRGIGSMANHNNRPNAVFRYNARQRAIFLYATKTIRYNEEIFVNYGDEYILHDPNIRTSTRRKTSTRR